MVDNKYDELISRFKINIKDFDFQKLEILKKLDDNNFNIFPLLNNNLLINDFNAIAFAIENGVDSNIFETKIFNVNQIEQLVLAKKAGIDITLIADPKFSAKQMQTIIKGQQNNLDVSPLINENLTPWELEKKSKEQEEYINAEKFFHKISYIIFPPFFSIFKKKLWNKAIKDKHAEFFNQKGETNLELEDYAKYELVDERNQIIEDYYNNELKDNFESEMIEAGINIDECNFDSSNPTELDNKLLETLTFNIEDVLWEILEAPIFQALKDKFNKDLIERIKTVDQLRLWAIKKHFYEKGKNNYNNNDKFEVKITSEYINNNIDLISTKISEDIDNICLDKDKLNLISSVLEIDLKEEDIKFANLPLNKNEIIEYYNDGSLKEAYEIGVKDAMDEIIMQKLDKINEKSNNLGR